MKASPINISPDSLTEFNTHMRKIRVLVTVLAHSEVMLEGEPIADYIEIILEHVRAGMQWCQNLESTTHDNTV